jgi:hypothetical protein
MSPLLVRMRATALHHSEVVGELTMLRAVVSTAIELVLGSLPGEISWVEVMNELATKF